jgi:hypothetical protein
LDTELQRQYDNYFEMFSTEGWKQLIEDLEDISDNFRIEDIKDEVDLANIQGQLKVLKQILYFEDSIRRTHDDLVGETDD